MNPASFPPLHLFPAPDDHAVLHGVGFNWFDYLGAGGTYAYAKGYYELHEHCHPALDDEAGWTALYATLDQLRPGFIRFGIPPTPHCDASGRFVPGTPHLERLARIARWAARNGCTLMLDTFLLPEPHVFPPDEAGYKLNANGQFQYAARDNRALAEHFLAPLLDHVVNDLGLEAVRWFNIINEPFCYGVYATPANQPDSILHYAEMYRELRAALDRRGIARDRLRLAALDLIFFFNWTVAERLLRETDLADHVDGLNVHFYQLVPDREAADPALPPKDYRRWAGLSLQIDDHLRRLADYGRVVDKPVMAAEIGTFAYGFRDNPAGTATYSAQLTVAEAIIRGLQAGVTTFGFWSLMNPNTIDGHWATFSIEGGRARHVRHVSSIRGLLSQAVRPGARVRALRPSWTEPSGPAVSAVQLQSEGAPPLVLLVNNHSTAALDLVLPDAMRGHAGNVVIITESGSLQTARSANDLQFSAPPRSVVLIGGRDWFLPTDEIPSTDVVPLPSP